MNFALNQHQISSVAATPNKMESSTGITLDSKIKCLALHNCTEMGWGRGGRVRMQSCFFQSSKFCSQAIHNLSSCVPSAQRLSSTHSGDRNPIRHGEQYMAESALEKSTLKPDKGCNIVCCSMHSHTILQQSCLPEDHYFWEPSSGPLISWVVAQSHIRSIAIYIQQVISSSFLDTNVIINHGTHFLLLF